MITIHKPTIEELWFRKNLIADAETMSYNAAWGGTVSFPEEEWKQWYAEWLEGPESQRYYRYLYDTEGQNYVGEIAYHFDERREIHICDVIIIARHRNKGFGTEGIRLLCEVAKENGIKTLYDDIAADNPSYNLFLKNGFVIDYQNDEIVMVKKEL